MSCEADGNLEGSQQMINLIAFPSERETARIWENAEFSKFVKDYTFTDLRKES